MTLSTSLVGQGSGRHKLDLRLMHRGGKLELNTKVLTFDVFNFHMYRHLIVSAQ